MEVFDDQVCGVEMEAAYLGFHSKVTLLGMNVNGQLLCCMHHKAPVINSTATWTLQTQKRCL